MPKRLLIACDHLLVLECMSQLLDQEFEVVGTAPDEPTLLAEAQRTRPDAIVLDLGTPGMSGIEAARRLSESAPSARLVFVTEHLDAAYLRAAFSAGALACVARQSASSELLTAIRRALDDRYYVTPLAGKEAARFTALHPKTNPMELFGGELTARQREVLELVAEGKSSKEISRALHISVKTVEFHRNKLMHELGLRTVAGLTRYAMLQGIIT